MLHGDNLNVILQRHAVNYCTVSANDNRYRSLLIKIYNSFQVTQFDKCNRLSPDRQRCVIYYSLAAACNYS